MPAERSSRTFKKHQNGTSPKEAFDNPFGNFFARIFATSKVNKRLGSTARVRPCHASPLSLFSAWLCRHPWHSRVPCHPLSTISKSRTDSGPHPPLACAVGRPWQPKVSLIVYSLLHSFYDMDPASGVLHSRCHCFLDTRSDLASSPPLCSVPASLPSFVISDEQADLHSISHL